MIEKFKNFKKHMRNSGEFFEKTSIYDNQLFGIEDFYSRSYLSGNYKIPITTINECYYELSELNAKYKFVYGYLQGIEKILKDENVKLDEEYFKLQDVSVKGESFLRMFELPDHYNNVIDYDVVYMKNLQILSDSVVKTNDSLQELSFYLTYIDKHSFFIELDNLYSIQDIFLEFYNEFTISIFGVKEDETMENIFSNVSTNKKLYINTNENKYKRLFITGVGDINNYIKQIKVYSYQDDVNSLNNGFIVYRLKDVKNINEFITVSDSNTELYQFTEKEYNEILSLITDEQKIIEKFFTEEFKLEKNTKMALDANRNFIIDFFNTKQNSSNLLIFYGKEK